MDSKLDQVLHTLSILVQRQTISESLKDNFREQPHQIFNFHANCQLRSFLLLQALYRSGYFVYNCQPLKQLNYCNLLISMLKFYENVSYYTLNCFSRIFWSKVATFDCRPIREFGDVSSSHYEIELAIIDSAQSQRRLQLNTLIIYCDTILVSGYFQIAAWASFRTLSGETYSVLRFLHF